MKHSAIRKKNSLHTVVYLGIVSLLRKQAYFWQSRELLKVIYALGYLECFTKSDLNFVTNLSGKSLGREPSLLTFEK